jgi:DNA-binding beta-propeller fold protein YncE
MRGWKFCSILILALGLGALGCGGGNSSSGVTLAIAPPSASVITNTTQAFSATVTGSTNTAVTWTVTCPTGVTAPACGTIDGNGVYTAPKTVPTVTTNGTAVITPTATITATATADTTKVQTATVTIISGIAIAVGPTNATVGTGQHFTFTANVSNPGCDNTVTSNNCLVVTWSLSTTLTGIGTIDPNTGVYTAPATAPSPNAVTITATSVKDTTVTATTTVTIVTATDPTLTSVSPKVAGLGSLFQDVYITGTGFISTNNVYLTQNGQVFPLTATVDSNSVIRARIPDSILAKPGVVQLSVSQQVGTAQNCAPDITQCQVVLTGVRPAVVGLTPTTIQQGTSGATSFNVNGGFFGTTSNASVFPTFGGSIRAGVVNNARQLTVTLGGAGTNAGDFTLPGLYPVAIHSQSDPTRFAVANLAVQPNFNNSAVTTVTARLAVGTSPSDVAINPATGMAVVVNNGSNDVTLIDLTTASPTIVAASICTAGVGAVAPCPSSGPKTVAIDYVRNLALVTNTGSKTIAVIDLAAKAVTSVTAPLTDPPAAIGVNPCSQLDPITNACQGRALVAIQNRPYGLLMDLSQAPPAILGPVSINTGANPRVAVDPRLNWAIVSPGGLGTLGVVDLSRQTANTITTLSRTSNVVTATVQTASGTTPLQVQAGSNPDTVLIQGVSDTTFNGIYQVTSVGPLNGQFTYTQTGAAQPDKTSFSASGTVSYAAPVVTLAVPITYQGIALNPETEQALLVDPSTSATVSFFSLLDQSITPLVLRAQNGAAEPGSIAGAYNPLTNLAVTVNPTANTVSLLDPTAPARFTSGSLFPSGAAPSAIAIDAGSNLAVVANQADNSVTILQLGAIQPFSITASSPKEFVVNSSLLSVGAPGAQTITVLGKGFTNTSVVRLDGNPLATTFVSDRKLTAVAPPSQLTAARRYALDVQNSDNTVTNATDFTVIQKVDVSSASCSTPQPSGVAIDQVQNIAAVSLPGCNSLALINMTSGTGQAISVGQFPLGVAVLPRLHYAVVANNGDGTASIVDELAGSVINTVTTGAGSVGAAADQDTGEVAIANSGANTLSIVNVASLSANSIPTGATPVAVAFDYETSQIAVASAGSNSVGIALDTGTTLQTSFSANLPTSVAYDPYSNLFLAASSLSNSVVVYDPSAQQQVESLRVGINPTSIAYNTLTGTLVSTNTGSHTITVADILSNKIRFLLTLPPAPVISSIALTGRLQFGLDIHPLTNIAVIADTANGRVLFIPLPY